MKNVVLASVLLLAFAGTVDAACSTAALNGAWTLSTRDAYPARSVRGSARCDVPLYCGRLAVYEAGCPTRPAVSIARLDIRVRSSCRATGVVTFVYRSATSGATALAEARLLGAMKDGTLTLSNARTGGWPRLTLRRR